jgi:MGT family glycosyltransferase
VNIGRGGSFFARAIEAFRNQPLQAIIVAPQALTCDASSNILLQPRIPQLEVLRHVQAVVCHAGHNTVCETLARGIPLVVTPIRDDQSVVAQQIVDAGAGIRLKFGRFTPAELCEAVWNILEQKEFREAARQIAQSFEAAGGARRAADLLEELL